MATGKHQFQRLVFNLAGQNLVCFADELPRPAKKAFGIATETIIEHFLYAKNAPLLKQLLNEAHLENGAF